MLLDVDGRPLLLDSGVAAVPRRKRRGRDREGVVLPDAPRQGREVQVGVAVAADALDVDPDVILVEDRHRRRPHAVPREPEEPHGAVKAPDGDGDEDPRLVAPLARESMVDVQVARRQDDDGEDDVPREEELVHLTSQRQRRRRQHERHGNRPDRAPDPVRQFALARVLALGGVLVQVDEGMHDGLHGADPRHISVEEQEGAVGPVGQPDEHVVPAGVQDEERHVGEAQDAGAVRDVGEDLPLRRFHPGIRLSRANPGGAEDDVDGDEVGDEEGLAARRHVRDATDRGLVARSKGRRVDEVGVELGDQVRRPRDEAEEGETDGHDDSREQDDEAIDERDSASAPRGPTRRRGCLPVALMRHLGVLERLPGIEVHLVDLVRDEAGLVQRVLAHERLRRRLRHLGHGFPVRFLWIRLHRLAAGNVRLPVPLQPPVGDVLAAGREAPSERAQEGIVRGVAFRAGGTAAVVMAFHLLMLLRAAERARGDGAAAGMGTDGIVHADAVADETVAGVAGRHGAEDDRQAET